MLRDLGCRYVIVGHSERRTLFGERDEHVQKKVRAALRYELSPILCVGESLTDREEGRTESVVTAQLNGSLTGLSAHDLATVTIAYEPVWAIGTGRTPTVADIEHIHEALRAVLVERFGDHGATVPILYGGSVKPDNASQILAMPEVGGALVGGASLKAADFLAIIEAA
jgi:triosephosphate isomerase (TIM)